MAYSSIVGTHLAPVLPSGRGSDLLGPSDNSDSGSDARGTAESQSDSDSTGTGERGAAYGAEAPEGGDIMPDRVVQIGGGHGAPEADLSEAIYTDLDDEQELEPDMAVDAEVDEAYRGQDEFNDDEVASVRDEPEWDIEGGPGLRQRSRPGREG
jgi:hypothetical protein